MSIKENHRRHDTNKMSYDQQYHINNHSSYAENMSSAPEVVSSANDDGNAENAPEVFAQPYIGAKDPKNAPEVIGAQDNSGAYGDAIAPMVTRHDGALDHHYQLTGDHKKPFHKRLKFWIIASIAAVCVVVAVVVGGVVGSQSSGDSDSDSAVVSETSGPSSSTTTDFSTAIISTSTSASTGTSATATATSSASLSFKPWENDDCTGTDQGTQNLDDDDCHSLDDAASVTILDLSDCYFYKYPEDDCRGNWYRHITVGACFNTTDWESFRYSCSKDP